MDHGERSHYSPGWRAVGGILDRNRTRVEGRMVEVGERALVCI